MNNKWIYDLMLHESCSPNLSSLRLKFPSSFPLFYTSWPPLRLLAFPVSLSNLSSSLPSLLSPIFLTSHQAAFSPNNLSIVNLVGTRFSLKIPLFRSAKVLAKGNCWRSHASWDQVHKSETMNGLGRKKRCDVQQIFWGNALFLWTWIPQWICLVLSILDSGWTWYTGMARFRVNDIPITFISKDCIFLCV